MKNKKIALKAEWRENPPNLYCGECKIVTRHTYAGIVSWYCSECGTIKQSQIITKWKIKITRKLIHGQMKIVFTSSKSVINAMVDTLKSPGYNMESSGVKYLAHNHDKSFSTIGIELTGERSICLMKI